MTAKQKMSRRNFIRSSVVMGGAWMVAGSIPVESIAGEVRRQCCYRYYFQHLTCLHIIVPNYYLLNFQFLIFNFQFICSLPNTFSRSAFATI